MQMQIILLIIFTAWTLRCSYQRLLLLLIYRCTIIHIIPNRMKSYLIEISPREKKTTISLKRLLRYPNQTEQKQNKQTNQTAHTMYKIWRMNDKHSRAMSATATDRAADEIIHSFFPNPFYLFIILFIILCDSNGQANTEGHSCVCVCI